MLLLVIVALIATRVFFKTARRSGLNAAKAASAPMIGLMVLLAINHPVMAILLGALRRSGATETTISWVDVLNGLFTIAVYLIFLRENFKAIDLKAG